MRSEIQVLRSLFSAAEFHELCTRLRADIVRRSGEVSECWQNKEFDLAANYLHVLKGLYGTIGYNSGMVWCDQVRRDTQMADRNLWLMQKQLDQETSAAIRMLDEISVEPH